MLIKLEKSDCPRNPVRDRQLKLPSVRTGSLADRTGVKFVNQIATALQGCGSDAHKNMNCCRLHSMFLYCTLEGMQTRFI